MALAGKRIVLGVCGGIAAYKAALVVRELMRRGVDVRVVMTESATRFVGPVTFTGLTGTPAIVNLWDPNYAGEIHVELGAWADAMLVVPTTMNTIGRLAMGQTDDALLATASCMRGPLFLAPAMHHLMWGRANTQRAVSHLRADGVTFLGPVDGPLASGESGVGRMMEPDEIVNALAKSLRGDLSDREILISAGPTVEDLDPVRFLGNRSTGRMGFAIAARAAARGAKVTLVAGPVALETPRGVTRVDVRSARDMQKAIAERRDVDVIVMAAAVADYRPSERAEQKIKKSGAMTLELVRNPDILKELGKTREGARPLLVGFALETENVVENARGKLARKNADLIVANHARDSFGKDTNVATLVSKDAEHELALLSKEGVADRILDRVKELLEA